MLPTSTENHATSPGRGKLVKVRGIENLYRYTTTDIYYAVFHREGRTVKRSLKTTDRLTAKQALTEVLRDAAVIDHQLCSITTLCQLLTLHMESRVPLKDTGTQAKLKYIQRLFIDTWPGTMAQKVKDIRRSQVDRWIAHHRNRIGPYGQKLSKGTLNEYIQFVRALFATAVDARLIAHSPAEGVKDFKRNKPIRRTPTLSEFHRIVADLRGQIYNSRAAATSDFVEFIGLSGLGNGEAASLRWGDFRFSHDGDGQVVWDKTRIHVMRQKTNRGFVIPVFPQLAPLLTSLYGLAAPDPLVKVLKIANARRGLINSCERLGLPRYGHRSLRRMFIENCIHHGIDVQTIAMWQGHNDNGQLILSAYSHVRQDFADEQAAKLTTLSL
jgi:integrase